MYALRKRLSDFTCSFSASAGKSIGLTTLALLLARCAPPALVDVTSGITQGQLQNSDLLSVPWGNSAACAIFVTINSQNEVAFVKRMHGQALLPQAEYDSTALDPSYELSGVSKFLKASFGRIYVPASSADPTVRSASVVALIDWHYDPRDITTDTIKIYFLDNTFRLIRTFKAEKSDYTSTVFGGMHALSLNKAKVRKAALDDVLLQMKQDQGSGS